MTSTFTIFKNTSITAAILFFILSTVNAHASLEDALSAVRNRDFGLAYELFLVEANDGNAEAQYRLAGMLIAGNGADKNIPLAIEWYNKAADLDHPKAIKKLTQLNSTVVITKDPITDLFKAARTGNINELKLLIKAGTNINHKDSIGSTALIEATRENKNDAVDFLLSQKADPNLVNNQSDTALLIASSLNNEKAVSSLLLNGADINNVDRYGATPLHFAVRRENLTMTEMLLKNGADIFKSDKSGKTVYDVTVGTNNKHLISIIHKAGGHKLEQIIVTRNLNAKKQLLTSNSATQKGWTSLMYAAWRGDSDILKVALEANENINHLNDNGMSALAIAANGGHNGIVSTLLSAGATLSCQDSDTHPLTLTIKSDHKQAAKVLIDALNKKTKCRPFLQNKLNQALSQERLEIAEVFFQYGISINNQGKTLPLLLMATKADENLVTQLIKNGADVNTQNELGETALMIASKSGNLSALQALIDHIASINVADRFGRTALMHGVLNDQVSSLEYLIEKGADPSKLSNENNSALMLAAENGYGPIVEKLVVFGNLDQKNNIGDTALIMAARNGHVGVTDILLKKGANPRLSNNKKEKALTVVNIEQKELYALIEKHSSSRSWIDDIF